MVLQEKAQLDQVLHHLRSPWARLDLLALYRSVWEQLELEEGLLVLCGHRLEEVILWVQRLEEGAKGDSSWVSSLAGRRLHGHHLLARPLEGVALAASSKMPQASSAAQAAMSSAVSAPRRKLLQGANFAAQSAVPCSALPLTLEPPSHHSPRLVVAPTCSSLEITDDAYTCMEIVNRAEMNCLDSEIRWRSRHDRDGDSLDKSHMRR